MHKCFFINQLLDYAEKLQRFTALELEVNGVKERTAKGYAIKDVAVWWLFDTFPECMRDKGFSWDEYLEVNK